MNNNTDPTYSGFDPIRMGKMFQLVEDMSEHVKEIRTDVKAQNSRVSKLELGHVALKSRLNGGFVTLTVILPIIVTLIWKFIV